MLAGQTAPIPDKPRIPGTPWHDGDTNIEFNQICMVKALNNASQLQLTDDGRFVIKTLAQLTNGGIPRLTNHWALNHLVESHSRGSWFAPECVIICPAMSLIRSNGLPDNLKVVDTFWEGNMEIPTDSIIFWKNSIPEPMKTTRYNQKVLLADKALEDQLKEARVTFEAGGWADTNELMALENRIYDLSQQLESNSQAQINKEVRDMGYSVFDLESSSNYSLEPNLDADIVDLGRRNSIESFSTHPNTFSGLMEIGDLGDGPLFQFARINNGEVTNPDDILRVFDQASLALEYYSDSPLNRHVLLVFAAEIYKFLSASINADEQQQVNIKAIKEFFSENHRVAAIIQGWADKNKQTAILSLL